MKEKKIKIYTLSFINKSSGGRGLIYAAGLTRINLPKYDISFYGCKSLKKIKEIIKRLEKINAKRNIQKTYIIDKIEISYTVTEIEKI